MPWNTSYLAAADAVLTVYSGVLDPAVLHEAVRSTLALARQQNTMRFLADCSTLEGGHSVVDLYELAKLVAASGAPPGLREAIVMPQLAEAASDVRFWETTCRNRGFTVRVFATMAEASAWLTTDDAGEA